MKLSNFTIFFIYLIARLEAVEICKTVKKDFQTMGRACYTCSSDIQTKCVTDPEMVDSCECQDEFDRCVVGLRGEIIVRGCEKETLNLTNPKYCKKTNCNSAAYESKRLSCYQCKNCVNAENLQECTKDIPDDECYTQFLSDGSANRGCKSDFVQGIKNVHLCKSAGCNNMPSYTTLSCILCNSNEFPDCGKVDASAQCAVEPTHICSSKISFGEVVSSACYTYKHFDYVERGCMQILPTYPNEKERKFYEFCYEDFCNVKCVEPISCFLTPVQSSLNTLTAVERHQPEMCKGISFCHTCQNPDGSLARGCGHHTTNNSCVYCQGLNGCNNRNPLRCHTCDSSKDPNCGQWSNPAAIPSEFCHNFEDSCAIIIRGQDTIRGCFKSHELQCNNTNRTCMTCNTDLCNFGIFPPNRRRCHICSKTKECSEAQNSKNVAVCPHYNINATCLTFADSNNEMTRACSTDTDSLKRCGGVAEPKCKICNSDGCNSIALMLDPVLSCIKCKGLTCAWGQRKDTALKCVNKFPYYLSETCITKVADRVIERGCAFDVGTCSDDHCDICATDGCNTQMHASQKCVQCKSTKSNETSCEKSAEGIKGSPCTAEFIPYEQRGCFTMRSGKTVIRGCASDLTAKALEDCKSDDNKSCDFCDGENCNNSLAPSSGLQMVPMIKLLVFMILLVAPFK